MPEIRLVDLTRDSRAPEVAQARELLLEYGRFVLAQAGPAHLCFGTLEKEAAALPHFYLDQGGGSLSAYIGESPAGFVAWREMKPAIAPDAWEMKRLWVRPEARGHSLGRLLTSAVLDRARAAQRTAVYLDTIPASMSNALRLYLDLGFKPCAPYNNNPVEGVVHLRLSL
jgi:putative acetyltransferase